MIEQDGLIIVGDEAWTREEWAAAQRRRQRDRERARERADYWREWRARNREKRNAYNREWMRRYRAEHPEYVERDRELARARWRRAA